MTAIGWTGFRPKKRANLQAPLAIKSEEISIVVPVKDNQNGIDNFISKFASLGDDKIGIKELIIVDNNSQPPIWLKKSLKTSHKVVKCLTPGPAAARNLGFRAATGSWILFMDSDCELTESTVSGYINSCNGSIGYAGYVLPKNQDTISNYYQSQETLIPPEIQTGNIKNPEYLITANCLVWKSALNHIGGFSEKITIPAGEDIDIGFRLREVGQISFALKSTAIHHFEPGFYSFLQRFYRYGIGNRLLADIYRINLTPRLFHPTRRKPINYVLGFFQWVSMWIGYEKRKFK